MYAPLSNRKLKPGFLNNHSLWNHHRWPAALRRAVVCHADRECANTEGKQLQNEETDKRQRKPEPIVMY